jgi:DNA-binding transcriptional ArsR family regulator
MATDVFAAIADPTRRAVLDLLALGPRNAGGIATEFPRLTQPGVSRHLKVLRQAKLVAVTIRAQQRIYRLNPEGLADLYEWVAKYQAIWPETLDALGRYLDARAGGEKAKGKKR